MESDTGWGVTVWHSDSTHRAVIVTTKLPEAPDGMVYHVWLDRPISGPVSAGLMTDEPVRPTSDPVAVFDFGQGA